MSMLSECRRSSNFPVDLNIHPSFNRCLVDLGILDEIFGFDGQKLAIREYGIAGRVWEAAYTMISFIRPPDTSEFDPPFLDAIRSQAQCSIIELGSGSGLVASLAAGMLQPGKDLFIATDLPEVCALLEHNLFSSSAPEAGDLKKFPVVVRALPWGDRTEAISLGSAFFGKENSTSRNLTHVICSDLIYFPDLFAPFLRTLLDLTSPPFFSELSDTLPGPSIFISYKVRSFTKETMFWTAFGLWFEFRPVLVREKTEQKSGQWRCFGVDPDDRTFLFVAHRRPDSFHWTIPLLDQDLLSGIGVKGSDLPKGDDTFENLLMMSLAHE